MNSFDAVVTVLAIIAIVTGFTSGLLRNLAAILGYVCAMPIALAATPPLATYLADQVRMSTVPSWAMFCAIFLLAGLALGALLRTAVNEMIGPTPSLPDRLAGSMLGAFRIGLLAVLLVLIFDRIIPADRQPAFLAESRLRPILSQAGQQGLKSLPPDVADYIDRLKRERGT
jgi:membrane protein required for colicin V production